MSQPDNLEAVRTMLAAMGITPEQLMESPPVASSPGLTVGDFHAQVIDALSAGQRRTYTNHLTALVTALGDRPLASVLPVNLGKLAREAKANAVKRDNARSGRGAEENAVTAFRWFFQQAVDNGYLKENPAAKVKKPRRLPNERRNLSASELAALWQVTTTTGDDPVLDSTIHRFHHETGARRGGALALTLRDLSRSRQMVHLHEKGEVSRWMPVSLTLLDALEGLAKSRGAVAPGDAVFRNKGRAGAPGTPITSRRYDYLHGRWQKFLAWADELHVSVHWLRHTAVTDAEKLGGFAVSRRFAGHTDKSDATTVTYLHATDEEVAAVQVVRTGEPHPLAPGLLA
jgi:site-specific recombinase XerC